MRPMPCAGLLSGELTGLGLRVYGRCVGFGCGVLAGFERGFGRVCFLRCFWFKLLCTAPCPPYSALTCLEKFSALWALHISRTNSLPVGRRSFQLSRLFIYEQALPMAWRQDRSFHRFEDPPAPASGSCSFFGHEMKVFLLHRVFDASKNPM